MRHSQRFRLVAAVALAVALPLASADAAGSGGSSSSSGNSSSSSSGSSSSSAKGDYVTAKSKVDAGNYRGAVPILEKIVTQSPDNADALNLLGYSQRKLGSRDKALAYYLKALKVEPNHVGANEYLGELYLEMNDLPKAEERLAVLAKACKKCEEQQELAQKIAAFKAKNSAS
ncbi:MAG: tetratricopeptide repeat protein [Dongiaceae bacterium]